MEATVRPETHEAILRAKAVINPLIISMKNTHVIQFRLGNQFLFFTQVQAVH